MLISLLTLEYALLQLNGIFQQALDFYFGTDADLSWLSADVINLHVNLNALSNDMTVVMLLS